MAQDVVDVTRELQLNRKITAAKSDYEKRVQNLVMRLRDTLIYILDARGVDCYVTPFEPSSLGAHRPGKSQVVLSVDPLSGEHTANAVDPQETLLASHQSFSGSHPGLQLIGPLRQRRKHDDLVSALLLSRSGILTRAFRFEEWRWRQRSSPTQPYASGRKFFPKTWNQATLVPRDS